MAIGKSILVSRSLPNNLPAKVKTSFKHTKLGKNGTLSQFRLQTVRIGLDKSRSICLGGNLLKLSQVQTMLGRKHAKTFPGPNFGPIKFM